MLDLIEPEVETFDPSILEFNESLPNVRKLFRPDPGYLLCDVDLSGADAQVVAWEANDADLKQAFRSGMDVHDHNGRSLWGSNYHRDAKPRKYTMRDELKRAVHGTNYGSGVKTMATTLGWTWPQVREFQGAWFNLHPGIKDWHRRVERDLQTTRQVRNKFGYRITYFDRPDNLLPKGLAWIPQSTVAIVCGRAGDRLRREVPWLSLLLQVHDSLIFQLPYHRVSQSSFETIRRHLEVAVPYPDPLTIPWGLACSTRNWGEVRKTKWDNVDGALI